MFFDKSWWLEQSWKRVTKGTFLPCYIEISQTFLTRRSLKFSIQIYRENKPCPVAAVSFEQIQGTTKNHSCEVWSNPISGLGGDVVWRNCLRMDAHTTDNRLNVITKAHLVTMWQAKKYLIWSYDIFAIAVLPQKWVIQQQIQVSSIVELWNNSAEYNHLSPVAHIRCLPQPMYNYWHWNINIIYKYNV